MTFLTYNKFVNEELDNFFQEADKHSNLKLPIDINTKPIDYQKPSFSIKPKMKETAVKHKKTWTSTKNGKNLF
jgi:hypothetical protein